MTPDEVERIHRHLQAINHAETVDASNLIRALKQEKEDAERERDDLFDSRAEAIRDRKAWERSAKILAAADDAHKDRIRDLGAALRIRIEYLHCPECKRSVEDYGYGYEAHSVRCSHYDIEQTVVDAVLHRDPEGGNHDAG